MIVHLDLRLWILNISIGTACSAPDKSFMSYFLEWLVKYSAGRHREQVGGIDHTGKPFSLPL